MPRQRVGQLRALPDDGKERPFAFVDERGLGEQPGVDRVEHQLAAHRQIDDRLLLGGEDVVLLRPRVFLDT